MKFMENTCCTDVNRAMSTVDTNNGIVLSIRGSTSTAEVPVQCPVSPAKQSVSATKLFDFLEL